MIDRVQSALDNYDKQTFKDVYREATGKELNSNCGDCIKDARLELLTWLRDKKYEQSNINLFINRYTSPNSERQKELDICYQLNSENRFIKNIIEVEGRNYEDFFRAMQAYPDDVNIIANADIYFNDTIELIKRITHYEAFCLTRWDYNGNGHANFMNRSDSQDAWVIRGKPKSITGDFPLGKAGCDNRIAYNLKQAGYIVKNPSLSIQSIHYHVSNFRTYNPHDRILEPYLLVKPTYL